MECEQRPSPEEALVRVQAYIAALRAENVPTALVEERVSDIWAWGQGVRLRRAGAAGRGAKSEEMREIQSRLDDLRKSEEYVRALRPQNIHYPYDTEEQARLAKLLNQMDISKADREALFKTLHGGDGLRSLLAEDLQSDENRRRLSARGIDECANKMTSVEWHTDDLELEADDGTSQHVKIKWRSGLEAVQHHLLSAQYDPKADLQLEPEIAADLRQQVFDDYKHSMLFYLASSFLDKGQYPMFYEFGSDASQYGKCGQEFWSVYITICWFCKRRRLMMDAKLIVGQLPKVLGADEKAHMYQHAIRNIFRSMNAAGRHGVQIHIRGEGDTVRAVTAFPLVHALALDHPEHGIVGGLIQGPGTECACSACLTPKDSLGDIVGAMAFPVRTLRTYQELVDAYDDPSGERALALHSAHLASHPMVAHAASGSKPSKRRRVDQTPAQRLAAAKSFVKERLRAMSYRAGVRPALLDFPAAGGGWAILGLSYDGLHMTLLGSLKRKFLLTLACYAKELGLKNAISTLNARLTSRGKHDGLDRCLPALFKCSKKPDKIALTLHVRGSELAQAAKVMMYVTADFEDICLIFCLFAEWFAATKPEGGHNMRSIVALRRAIEKYDAAIKASRFADTQIKGMVKCMEVVTHHRAAHLPETIGALGWANAADTNICERRHVDIKAEFERTTRRPANAVDQVCERFRLRECVSSSFVSRSTPDPLNPAAAREPPATNAAVGNHPLREFSFPQRVHRGRKAPAVGAPCANASALLWAPEAVAATLGTRKAQEEAVANALRRYYALQHSRTDVPVTPIQLKSGVKLVDSANGNALIGIAHASTNWNGVTRYNDVEVVLSSEPLTFGYARMALVMCVDGEDLVLVRHYRSATPPARAARFRELDDLLGPCLEFVPLSDPNALEVVRATALHDVWKLEDDVRKPGRFFVNQFVGAYCPTADDTELVADVQQ